MDGEAPSDVPQPVRDQMLADELRDHLSAIAMEAHRVRPDADAVLRHCTAAGFLLPEVRKLERLSEELSKELQEELTLPGETVQGNVIAFRRRNPFALSFAPAGRDRPDGGTPRGAA